MVWIKGFAQFPSPGPARLELVALMHLSAGRREEALQGFTSLREMCLAWQEKRARSSALKSVDSAPDHHCISGMLFPLVIVGVLVIGHFYSGTSAV